jgi:hypothetical protein
MSTDLRFAVPSATMDPVRSRARTAAYAAWVLAGVVGVALGASPFHREAVAVWAMAGLVVSASGRPWQEARAVVLAWVPFLAAMAAYDLARTVAGEVSRSVAVTPQLDLERFLFAGAVPSEVLQRHLHLPALVAALGDVVYLSHFVVPVATAAWLWRADRARFHRFTGTLVVLSFGAALCFAVQPTAPPWYASDQGRIEVERTIGHGLTDLGLSTLPGVLDRGRGDANPFAAIPSLHTGYAALVALTLAAGRRRRVRLALAAYPVTMAFVLVQGGEHYVVDALAVLPLLAGSRWLVGRVLR